jgi:hypothetical protein
MIMIMMVIIIIIIIIIMLFNYTNRATKMYFNLLLPDDVIIGIFH